MERAVELKALHSLGIDQPPVRRLVTAENLLLTARSRLDRSRSGAPP
jgi:hypothetical protein